MTIYKCYMYEIKNQNQVKAMLVFTFEFVSSCCFIHYIYTTHTISAGVLVAEPFV